MKLEIARGLFLVGALGVAALALAAWEQPSDTGPQCGARQRAMPAAAHRQGECDGQARS